ncbi:hypothetical protein QR685DRAFT_578826 [Neurospora intermedia]|uniref:Uncharacterized protein n=1 Tax=Neurospora intermedia TaxID=5142 RepID=A0ABR3DT96_NEUIN
MASTSSKTASPAPSPPSTNPRLQISTSIQNDDANTESATSSTCFQRSSAPSPSPTLPSPPQPLPSKVEPITSQLEPSPSIYSPRPDPLPCSADATRSTSPVGVGPTRPNSPAHLVNEDEPLVPEAPSSPVLTHSVPFPVPVGARVVVPELVQDVRAGSEPGLGCETTTTTTPEEEDSAAAPASSTTSSTSPQTHLDTGIDTETYMLTPISIPSVTSTRTRESPERRAETAVVMEGKGNEGVEDGRRHPLVKVKEGGIALLELKEVLSSEKILWNGKVEMSEAGVMKVQGQDTRPSRN